MLFSHRHLKEDEGLFRFYIWVAPLLFMIKFPDGFKITEIGDFFIMEEGSMGSIQGWFYLGYKCEKHFGPREWMGWSIDVWEERLKYGINSYKEGIGPLVCPHAVPPEELVMMLRLREAKL